MAKIVMLCKGGESTAIVYDALSKHYDISQVILEGSDPTSVFLKKRIKRLGFFRVAGQVAFSVLIAPILRKTSKKRKEEILDSFGYSADVEKFMERAKPFRVDSVNSQKCIEKLKEVAPDVIVVQGTRIISKEVLECVDAKFINMHTGITPKYRGCHGAYWAYYNNDPENAGVTVHLVDTGIDTGGILYQSCISTTDKDNFTTYPLLQTCVGVEDEIKAINDVLSNNIKVKINNLPSSIYSHPTFFQYLFKRIKNKVK